MAGLERRKPERPARVYPQNHSDLSTFLKEVKRRGLLPREEWSDYQEVVSLIAEPEWKWSPEVHEPLLRKLETRIGAYLSTQGLYLSSPVQNAGTGFSPSSSHSLASYLKVVWSHKTFTDYDDPIYMSLREISSEEKWDNSNPDHLQLLESFEAQTGVLFTSEGPYWLQRGVVLTERRGVRGNRTGPIDFQKTKKS
jgi:hypothetical protein